jgi:N-acetylglucosaminyldiphosphoundecaprenol N-acetyl-beta-D-mannosaminyltransferase
MQVNDQKYGNIFGVSFNSTSTDRVLRQVRTTTINFPKIKPTQPQFFVVTPNPEQVMLAQRDNLFKNILNSSDLAVPDAVGIPLAFKYLKLNTPQTPVIREIVAFFQGAYMGLALLVNKAYVFDEMKLIKGRELFLSLISLANKLGFRVYLIGGSGGTAQKTANDLKKNYKNVSIEASDGPVLDENAIPVSENDILTEKDCLDKINKFAPHFLFVAFGAPKQEKWVKRNWRSLPVPVVMVVGGTFDYVSGKTKLPPKIFSGAGLEWLWRLITTPKRVKRILTAFPVFPLKVFFYKIRHGR